MEKNRIRESKRTRALFDNSFETWVSEHSEEQVQKLVNLHLEIKRLQRDPFNEEEDFDKACELVDKGCELQNNEFIPLFLGVGVYNFLSYNPWEEDPLSYDDCDLLWDDLHDLIDEWLEKNKLPTVTNVSK